MRALLLAAATVVSLLPMSPDVAHAHSNPKQYTASVGATRPFVAPTTQRHSRLVFAAAEEDSTLAGFTSGRVPSARTY
jgi:hypothetical protein